LSGQRVIIVEDEPLTRRAFAAALREAGFEAIEASDAFACRAAMRGQRPDIALVDLGLPGLDGLTLARELRERSDLGLIIVSRRAEPEARIEALDLGVDDFLVKPVHLGELVARVRSVQRRRGAGAVHRRLQLGAFRVDLDRRTVAGLEGEVSLTRGEFELLGKLLVGAGKIVSREELLASISAAPTESDLRSVDVLVSRLRRKLGDSPAAPRLILTAPGFGYRLAHAPTPE
jgi:two-component system, OmpR family, torCAD operon response regulator TorR